MENQWKDFNTIWKGVKSIIMMQDMQFLCRRIIAKPAMEKEKYIISVQQNGVI